MWDQEIIFIQSEPFVFLKITSTTKVNITVCESTGNFLFLLKKMLSLSVIVMLTDYSTVSMQQ